MKINIIKTLAVIVLAGSIMIPAATFAAYGLEGEGQNEGGATVGAPDVEGQNNGGAEVGAPATEGQNSGGATVGAPDVEGQNEGGAEVGAPLAEGQNSGGATPKAPISEGQNQGGSVPTPSTPVANVSGGGSSAVTSVTSVVISPSCPLITSYMRMGGTNSTSEVTKLQTFLKDVENIDVNITGVYDAKTFEAVKTFQSKYASTVLAPWGTSIPSGYVFLTTLKTINAKVCNTTMTLTPAELAQIEATKTTVSVSNEIGVNNTASSTLTNTSTTTNDSQVGAVAQSSIASKIWKFIKGIFGR